MIEYIILLSLGLIGLLIASYTDFRTREVPDWLNFSLIATALGSRAIYSAINMEYLFILEGLIGLAVTLVLGYIMFYAGQWGGGDSKMIMALGAIFGMPLSFEPIPLLIIFMINMLIIGAFYGLLYSIVLAIINRKKFFKEWKRSVKEPIFRKVRKIAIFTSAGLIIAILMFIQDRAIMWLCISLTAFTYLSLYMVMFVKAVEKSSMYKEIDPNKITEGEWIAKEYYDGKKYICGPKDLGISKKQISKMKALKRKGKIKKIKIKIGIPFVPSFLLAYIATLAVGAWWITIL